MIKHVKNLQIQCMQWLRGVEWVNELCYGIVKEGCIPHDWKLCLLIHFTKVNVTLCIVVHAEGSNW